jgi:methyltransferase (TIGR00027 family)
VALGRAVADAGLSHVPGFADPTARVFLNDKGKQSLAKIAAAKSGMRREMARGMGDLMALRTMAIDAAVRDAMARGARQLVIVGAGYDGRAWRMPELAGMRVFEVDQAATQADKRRTPGGAAALRG